MEENVIIEELSATLRELLRLPRESEWVEFKVNNSDPQQLGEYISALSNSAALHQKQIAYLVWGIEDSTHKIIGTTFKPRLAKVKKQELENWLLTNLHPQVEFVFREWIHNGSPIVMLEIKSCLHTPVRFQENEFIRVGSYKKRLKDHPEKERELWSRLSTLTFEEGVAADGQTEDDVLALLDYPTYFDLLGAILPSNKSGILERLVVDRLISRLSGSRYKITNMGALLFAKKLSEFSGLSRKALRVIKYKGVDRVETVREHIGTKGYASGFEGMISYMNSQLPENEVIEQALRREVRMYPEKAIRELVPNALIHQDFAMSGTGPMVEIFTDRLEISNPGLPLIDTLRFIDHSPRSRNEVIADLMRRLHICEERGSGIDKVIFHIELFQLPPPDFRTDSTHTRTVLFAHQELGKMDKVDKIRACYQHCCLMHVSNKTMTNTTLRRRFQIKDSYYPVASRIIRDTIDAKLIKPGDEQNKSRKHAKYLPFWA